MLVWQDTWLLLGLIPLMLVWLLLWLRQRRTNKKTRPALPFSSLLPIAQLPASPWLFWASRAEYLRVLALALLVVAMARPQMATEKLPNIREGVAIMLALDASGSMQALDLDTEQTLDKRRNRLEVVKDVVAEFVQQRQSDQLGMVVFGTEAYTQCPLTHDHNVLHSVLEHVEIGMAGSSTAIGSAIGAAAKRLHKVDAKSKVIVLLTDGVNNSGKVGPIQAAEIAKALGIRVYTIGAGTRGQAPRRERHPLLGERYVNEEVDIDEDSLSRIAEMTGGLYFRAEDMKGLREVYARIDQLEKSAIEAPTFRHTSDLFPLFVGLSLMLLVFEIVLFGTRLRRVP